MTADAPTLSVVVIGRNEGERLVRCLRSVAAMRLPDSVREVIYVDSASSDGSAERAAALGVRVIGLPPGRLAPGRARNAGWRAAAAAMVLFLDGDTVLDPDFVAAALPAFATPAIAVVSGHRRELDPRASIFQRVVDLDWIYPPGPSAYCGGDALMRRDVLEAVGGFDETLIAGEEPELCQRIRAAGHIILHIDHPMTLHDLAMTRWRQYWRRAVRTGRAYIEVADRCQRRGSRLWRREVRTNLMQGTALVALPAIGVGLSVWTASLRPLLAVVALLTLLVCRTAARARWRSPEWATRVLYAIHSHLLHVPILVGQLGYRWERWRDRRSVLRQVAERE